MACEKLIFVKNVLMNLVKRKGQDVDVFKNELNSEYLNLVRLRFYFHPSLHCYIYLISNIGEQRLRIDLDFSKSKNMKFFFGEKVENRSLGGMEEKMIQICQVERTDKDYVRHFKLNLTLF